MSMELLPTEHKTSTKMTSTGRSSDTSENLKKRASNRFSIDANRNTNSPQVDGVGNSSSTVTRRLWCIAVGNGGILLAASLLPRAQERLLAVAFTPGVAAGPPATVVTIRRPHRSYLLFAIGDVGWSFGLYRAAVAPDNFTYPAYCLGCGSHFSGFATKRVFAY